MTRLTGDSDHQAVIVKVDARGTSSSGLGSPTGSTLGGTMSQLGGNDSKMVRYLVLSGRRGAGGRRPHLHAR